MKTLYESKLPTHIHGHLKITESDDGYLVITTHETGETGYANNSELRLIPKNMNSLNEVFHLINCLTTWHKKYSI